MRIAFFSPMPPSRSGIADYSAALVEPLSRLADVTVFEDAETDPGDSTSRSIRSATTDIHAFAYEQALRNPGVVVMHEANLHHLIAEITIKRNDWDAYLREVEYDGGPAARLTRGAFARWRSVPTTKAFPCCAACCTRPEPSSRTATTWRTMCGKPALKGRSPSSRTAPGSPTPTAFGPARVLGRGRRHVR